MVVVGGLLAMRRPRLRVVHAAVLLAVVAVNVAGADCPLTTLELALREAGGGPPLRDGFLGQYLFWPLGLDVRATSSQLAQLLAVLVPNAVANGVLLRRRLPRPVVA